MLFLFKVSFFAMKKALHEPSARDRETEERNR